MPTFLTTNRMDPRLVTRIRASIGVRRKGRPFADSPLARLLVRVVAATADVTGMALVASTVRRDRQAQGRARAALLADVRHAAASVDDDDRAALRNAEGWLTQFAGAYEGDYIADDLRAPGALAARLAKPAMYVRGPILEFASAERMRDAVAESAKDSLLLCLLDPPASRAERALLSRVHTAYAGAAAMQVAAGHVRRLDEAARGFPYFAPEWAERVQAATNAEEVSHLKKEFDRAPIAEAVQAAKSRLLIAALDEPGAASGPTELDGERPHEVRVGLFDTGAARVLLRWRKQVDPSWISSGSRINYAAGLDSCAVAMDIADTVRAPAQK